MNRMLPVLLAGLALSPRAEAFTTRVHIALANDVRGELLASPDGRTIRLEGGDRVVRLSEEDARAVREWPLAFRAGAIGPDNFVFPAMTDLTHAIGLRPYDQCEDLYQLAVTDQERAYAMGCFLHGSSDAVAHHYVNHLTGETFTLNPISADREDAWSNVVRHIVSESMLQEAWLEADPTAFERSAMLHAIPEDFVLRAVMHPDSPVWERMTTHALPAWEAVDAADPNGTLLDKVSALEVAPAEHLALLPLYVDQAHMDVDLVIPALEAKVADMQDPTSADGSQLRVGPGNDGTLGTEDDDTDCAITCPTLYATYFTLVSLLEPQAVYGGASAADEIVLELHGDLDELLPAYVQTVSETSALLNGPLAPGESSLDLGNLDVSGVIGPLQSWSDDLVSLNWDLIARTVLPQWVLDVEAFLSGLGVPLDLGDLLESFFAPRLEELRAAVMDVVVAQLAAELGLLTDEYERTEGSLRAEFQSRLEDGAPDGVSGSLLDDLGRSGLYMHSFNIVAVTLADHRMMLPTDDDWAGVGPASFDASYTLAWSQPAACDYLVEAVFPLGADLAGLHSLQIDGTLHRATLAEEPPVECHDGSLGAFAASPDAASCGLTDLDDLLRSREGSLSRAFPPEVVGADVVCQDLTIEGLGGPLPDPTTGPTGTDTDPRNEGNDHDLSQDGCGCATGGGPSGAWLLLALLAVVACKRDDPEDKGTTSTGLAGSGTTSTPAGTPTTASGTTSSGVWSTGAGWELAQELGLSVWHGRADWGDGERAWELQFDGPRGLVAEVHNPFGPVRGRTLRSFVIDADGASVDTIVQSPAGWPGSDDEGATETWELTLVPGAVRELHVTRGGTTAVFVEGEPPVPSGLTAVARAFEPGGDVDDAFCSSGANGFDYSVLFDFARGGESRELVAEEVVAGVGAGPWYPSGGAFGLADLSGFDRDGGTDVNAPTNWVVRYVGRVAHPGGTISIRERNDSVEDGVWAWVGSGVGGGAASMFLEVHGFLWFDGTPDQPVTSYPAGNLPIEFILVRCGVAIEDVELEVNLDGGGWQSAANLTGIPELSEDWFPPALH